MSIARDLIDKSIILGVKIDDRPLDWFLAQAQKYLAGDLVQAIFTPNPEICLKATEIKGYKEVLNSATMNLPDGIGLKFGAKILGIKLKNRVTGVDFSYELLKNNPKSNAMVILRGDSLTKADDLKNYFSKKFPQLNYKITTINKSEKPTSKIINQILENKTQILFVCLGAPEQEFYINELKTKLTNVTHSLRLALGVGGTFDFLCGKISRAPKMLRQIGAEWLYRLYKEPKRLKRIKNATADFLLKCYEWSRRIKTTYRENVMGVIQNDKQEYLIQKNPRLENHWQFPQGGIDKNEKPEAAVLREVIEELNLQPHDIKMVNKFKSENTYQSPRPYQLLHGYKGQKQTAYLLHYSGGINEANFTPTDEASEIKWAQKDELLKTIHPVRKDFVTKLFSEI